jgi:hypothetical protein
MIAWSDYAFIGTKVEIRNDIRRKDNKTEDRIIGIS